MTPRMLNLLEDVRYIRTQCMGLGAPDSDLEVEFSKFSELEEVLVKQARMVWLAWKNLDSVNRIVMHDNGQVQP